MPLRRGQHEPNRDDVSPYGGGPQRKDETSSSHATADPPTSNCGRNGGDASGCCACSISAEDQRRSDWTRRCRFTNRLNREDNGPAGVCACSCQEIERRGCRRLHAGDIECQLIGRDLQCRAAAERRHDGHTATRRFGGRRVHGNNQQAGYDTGREQATHIAGDEDRRW